MRSFLLSLLLALFFHALLAVGLIAYLEYAPSPDVFATLDVTSVELSFAEKVEESAAISPVPPLPSPQPLKPKETEKPPEEKIEKRLPPEPNAPSFPEPKEDAPQLTSPLIPHPSSPSSAPRQARIDAPPSPKRTIRPDYPKGARQRGEQGSVTLEIRVTEKGDVSVAKIVASSGFTELDEAAVKAAKKAKFTPAKLGNKPVASTARLKLEFKLK